MALNLWVIKKYIAILLSIFNIYYRSDNHKSASKHENESKASWWTANPFTKVKDHKKEGNKEEYTNSHKKWFPNPFAPPKIKSEEEKLGKLLS